MRKKTKWQTRATLTGIALIASLAPLLTRADLYDGMTILLGEYKTFVNSSPTDAGNTVHRDLMIRSGSILDFSYFNNISNYKTNATTLQAAGYYGRVILKNGQFYLHNPQYPNGDRGPIRFLSASMVFNENGGGFPDEATSRQLSTQLRRAGYNMVRLHYVDSMLMRCADGVTHRNELDFDPQQVSRFVTLLAELKKQGIYWMLDLMSSDSAAFSTKNTGFECTSQGSKEFKAVINGKERLYWDPDMQRHWKQLASKILNLQTQLYGKVTRIGDDNALAGVILANETDLPFLISARKTVPTFLSKVFNNDLCGRYYSKAYLEQAWGPLEAGESFRCKQNAARTMWIDDGSVIHLPQFSGSALPEPSPRLVDFSKTLTKVGLATTKWMKDYVQKSLNMPVLATQYNGSPSLLAGLTRESNDFVDLHSYQDHPVYSNAAAQLNSSSIAATSALPGRNYYWNTMRYYRVLAANRIAGKPFTVSEYGHPYWSDKRREAGIVMPTMAALQDWDMITRFTDHSVLTSYDMMSVNGVRPPRVEKLYSFAGGVDPVFRAGEVLAALLYGRRDLKFNPSTATYAQGTLPVGKVVEVRIPRWRIYNYSLSEGKTSSIYHLWNDTLIPEDRSMGHNLSLYNRYSIRFCDESKISYCGVRNGVGYDANVVFANNGVQVPMPPGTLIQDNRIDITRTNEMSLKVDPIEGTMQLATPRTIAVSFNQPFNILTRQGRSTSLKTLLPTSGSANLASELSISTSSADATVSLSVMDSDWPNRRIADSRRLLLIVNTDAKNTDHEIKEGLNGTQTIYLSKSVGGRPILFRKAYLEMAYLTKFQAKDLLIIPVASNGSRMACNPSVAKLTDRASGVPGVHVKINTNYAATPTPYFEICTISSGSSCRCP